MQIFPVFFHDWHGQALRQNGCWHLVPKHLSDHLGLDWKGQYRKIMTSDLAEGVHMMPSILVNRGQKSMGMMPMLSGSETAVRVTGEQDTLTLKLPYFGAWVLSITTSRVPEIRRAVVVEMKRNLLLAIDRQLQQQFGLPGLVEAEDLAALPMPPHAVSQMDPDAVRSARRAVLACFAATRLMRVGLPASRVAPVVKRSIYWARQQQRHLRRIGLVPLTPAQARLLDQPSLFGEG